jgi:tetratricopeptide (TPR) repeat protein
MARDEDEITTESLLMDIEDYSNPEDLVKQAGFLLDDGKWLDARRFLKKAIELDENYADAYALLGWAVFNDPSDMDNKLEGERLIKKGLRLNPGRYLHFLYLGKVYSALGQYEFAELHFVKALELNIECSEAKEEIKRIHHR